MKLWEFLKSNMLLHLDKIAFTKDKITYKELIEIVENKRKISKGKIEIAEGESKQAQAIKILRLLAEEKVVVPVTDKYGIDSNNRILSIVKNNNKIYDDLAFIVFTSGTTGKPKGVMLTDENIIENIKAIDSYFDVKSKEKILIIRPLVHISALTGELLYGLYKGLEIDFYEEDFQAKRLASYISNNNIEILCLAPTVMYYLSNYLEDGNVKVIAISGERISDKLILVLKEKYKKIDFYNVYGLSECSPRVSALLPKDFYRKGKSVGKAIYHTEVKLDRGELIVKSPSVMKGYLEEKSKTKEKIRSGYLYTGDMAKIDKEGYIYILGRKDEMIIRSGMNIYPYEIESKVNEIKGVENSLVYGEDDINYGQKICLKVVGNIDVKQLREELSKKLSTYLMPSKIEIVNSLPMTVSGKVKRK